MKLRHTGISLIACLAFASSIDAAADGGDKPWLNPALDPDRRAELVVAQMTREEKQGLVFAYFGTDAPWKKFTTSPEALAARPVMCRASRVWAFRRNGPPTPASASRRREARKTSASAPRCPRALATAATWDPDLARRAGAMIGAEARASGFNVMLAGSVNLVRDPRNGRNFEYAGEDPLLAGVMVGAQIKGIESNHIISTIKHFALNDQETDRNDAQRGHRSRPGAHVGPARVPDRHRAVESRLGHVRVQQGVGRALPARAPIY